MSKFPKHFAHLEALSPEQAAEILQRQQYGDSENITEDRMLQEVRDLHFEYTGIVENHTRTPDADDLKYMAETYEYFKNRSGSGLREASEREGKGSTPQPALFKAIYGPPPPPPGSLASSDVTSRQPKLSKPLRPQGAMSPSPQGDLPPTAQGDMPSILQGDTPSIPQGDMQSSPDGQSEGDEAAETTDDEGSQPNYETPASDGRDDGPPLTYGFQVASKTQEWMKKRFETCAVKTRNSDNPQNTHGTAAELTEAANLSNGKEDPGKGGGNSAEHEEASDHEDKDSDPEDKPTADDHGITTKSDRIKDKKATPIANGGKLTATERLQMRRGKRGRRSGPSGKTSDAPTTEADGRSTARIVNMATDETDTEKAESARAQRYTLFVTNPENGSDPLTYSNRLDRILGQLSGRVEKDKEGEQPEPDTVSGENPLLAKGMAKQARNKAKKEAKKEAKKKGGQ